MIILLSVPFAAIGVALGIDLASLPLSMPGWLGMIMLAGIVVNDAIVLVEFIERDRGLDPRAAIVEAARLRPTLHDHPDDGAGHAAPRCGDRCWSRLLDPRQPRPGPLRLSPLGTMPIRCRGHHRPAPLTAAMRLQRRRGLCRLRGSTPAARHP